MSGTRANVDLARVEQIQTALAVLNEFMKDMQKSQESLEELFSDLCCLDSEMLNSSERLIDWALRRLTEQKCDAFHSRGGCG